MSGLIKPSAVKKFLSSGNLDEDDINENQPSSNLNIMQEEEFIHKINEQK